MRKVKRADTIGEKCCPALRLIFLSWEQSHWDIMSFPFQPGLFMQRKVKCVQLWDGGSTQVCPHTLCCSKIAECVPMWSPDKTAQDLRTGGFWLVKSGLLWCHAAHNGMSMEMLIVLCLPRWNNMQLSIAKRGENYAVPVWKQSWDCSGIQVMLL